jgi:hypothetical protein
MEIRYRPPVLLSQLLSETIFSFDTITAMVAYSEIRMSL